MNKTRTIIMVLAAALLISVVGAGRASAVRPFDDGEPVGTSTDPLETSTTLQVIVVGRGSVRGSGFNCPGTCSRTFHKGDPIGLFAQEGSGYEFSGWQGACGRAPRNHSCTFGAGDVTVVRAVFVQAPPAVATSPVIGAIQAIPTAWVKVLGARPGLGIKNGRTMRKIDVQFDVGATSTVRYELRQNGTVLQSWTSSPFSGRSLRTIWIDDRFPAGTYELGLRITTGAQVRSFHGPVVLPPPQ